MSYFPCPLFQEHESEGGRTPLMKAARAGHLQAVQFLVSKGADVNRHTSNNDHTVLSLASAGGHISVVQYLLIKGALPSHLLRVNALCLFSYSTNFLYMCCTVYTMYSCLI